MRTNGHSDRARPVAGAQHGAAGGRAASPGRGWRRRARTPALLLALVVILLVTLVPGDGPRGEVALCLLCGDRGAADLLLNVALFLPLGVALALRRGSVLRLALVPPLLSLAIEATQLAIPGRHTMLADLTANAAGGWIGLLAARDALRRAPLGERPSGLWAAAWGAGAALVFLGTGWLLQPRYPASEWYGQWTARLAHLQAYGGRVLSAEIGGAATPSRRLEDPARLRARLAGGAPVRVRFVAGPAPDGVAPIFSIFDERQREILLLGADRADLVIRYRTRGAHARFDQPDLRLRDAFLGVAPGDTLALMVRQGGDGWCARLEPPRGPAGRCGLAHTVGRGWALLRHPAAAGRLPRGPLDALWAAFLALPVGWWLPRRRGARLAAAALPLAALAAGWPLPLLGTAWAAAAGTAAGLLAGAGLARAARQARSADRSPADRTPRDRTPAD